MRNFTFFKVRRSFPLFLTILFFGMSVNAQYFNKHYIAPANWNYFTSANEIVVCTNSAATANITVSKSDGTVLTTLTATQGTPAVYRFAAAPNTLSVWAQSTVLNAAGLIVTSDQPVSVNVRDVMSDAAAYDPYIKGNASLFSFGNAGIGLSFRVGYYRNVPAADLGYSIMAIENGTVVTANGTTLATLNAGQSYIIPSTTYGIGTLVTATKGSVMTVYKHIDSPGGCGDGTFDQIPPVSVLGNEYIIYRSSGTATAEQNTVVATVANTVVTNSTFDATTGALIGTSTTTLVNAGDYITYGNGDGSTPFSANRITATNNVAVYAGQAQSCEVDITSVTPISSPCNGSKSIETYKFRNYTLGDLPYFGYVLVKDATSIVEVNGANLETLAGARRQLGTTGWYLIDFTSSQISSPTDILITSPANLVVSMVQQGGGFSMSSIFSNFVTQPETPTVTYTSIGNCSNVQGLLAAASGYTNYQWFYNGTLINGATSPTYTTTTSGLYSYSALLPCGDTIMSLPYSVVVTTCADLAISKTVDNPNPIIGSNVTFTVTATNNGPNDATGVLVSDVLQAGYTIVSATPSVGSWVLSTWNIGNFSNGATATLTIVATVKANGSHVNTASITGNQNDSSASNNSASVTPMPNNPPVANDVISSNVMSTAGATAISPLSATDSDGTIASYTVSSLPVHGVLSVVVGGVTIPVTALMVLTPAQIATLMYAPNGTFIGNDTFTFTATDNLGISDSTPATYTIPVLLDTDGDGVPDVTDLDDDNDGIFDVNELSCAAVTSIYVSANISNISQIASSLTVNATTDAVVPFTANIATPLSYGAGAGKKITGINFSSGSLTVDPSSPIGTVFIRRNLSSSNPNKSIIWMEDNGSSLAQSSTLLLSKPTTEEALFSNGYYNVGADNVFDNTGTTNVSNIERIDVVFNSGFVVANPLLDYVLFTERGKNDNVTIAAITGINSLGIPTSFGPAQTVTPGSMGTLATIPYTISKKGIGDTEFRPQNIGNEIVGLGYVTMQTLGIPAQTKIYGYSILPADYNVGNIIDWNTYPTNTTDAVGGVDIGIINYFFSSCTADATCTSSAS